MSRTYSRSVPGECYCLQYNTLVYYPLEVETSRWILNTGDIVLVIANEQSASTLNWSLVLYNMGTRDQPIAKLGWIENDNLRPMDWWM